MLPKAHRLHQDKEIKELIKKGRSFFLPEFTIKYSINNTIDTKIGFVVSTKVDKRAVVRHRLTRQLREVSRELLPDTNSGYSLLIIAKKRALDLNFDQIRAQLIFALSKIKIYNKS